MMQCKGAFGDYFRGIISAPSKLFDDISAWNRREVVEKGFAEFGAAVNKTIFNAVRKGVAKETLKNLIKVLSILMRL